MFLSGGSRDGRSDAPEDIDLEHGLFRLTRPTLAVPSGPWPGGRAAGEVNHRAMSLLSAMEIPARLKLRFKPLSGEPLIGDPLDQT
jgi:hypothetical protein